MIRYSWLVLTLLSCRLLAAEAPPVAKPIVPPTAEDRALAARVRTLAEATVAGDAPTREAANFLLNGPQPFLPWLSGAEPATGGKLGWARQAVTNGAATLERERDWPRPAAVTIPRASGPVALAGGTDDPVWQHAWTSSDVYPFNRRDRATAPATAWRMLWDDTYLYVAFDCDDAEIVAPDCPRDGEVYSADCVELFLRTPAEPVRYWELVVSPRGSVFDAFHTKRMNGWGMEPGGPAATMEGLRYATRPRPGGYITEIWVPWTAFPEYADGRTPKAGDRFLGMLARLDKTGSELRPYAAVPLLSWGHNIWNHIPLVLGEPAVSAAALAAEREIQAMQRWWERNQKWFVYGGVLVGLGFLGWMFFALGRWYRTDKQATFKCGTLIYSKKGLMLMFAWLLWGDFCFTLMETIAGSVMPWKFKSLNASNTTTSLIMSSLPAVFNFFVTPSISIWSDRIRTRWGRRIPFMLTTMPFLVASLVLIAYTDQIAAWIGPLLTSGSPFDQAKVAILVLAVCAGMFDLFNMFVCTVYWYLFNDVVPTEMMGRFMGYFRVVSTLTGALYNFFLFQHALTHMKELYLLAAGIYLVGFGAMLLRVKESDYPPPEDAGPRATFREKARHVVESLSISHYLHWTLSCCFGALGSSIGVFGGFLMLSLVLTMSNIGILGGINAIIGPVFFLFVGALVDRWHPVRVTAYTGQMGVFFSLGGWLWLFVDHPSPLVFMLTGVVAGVFGAPIGALNGVAGLPSVFALLPREKFGQYNGAMCMTRAVFIFAGGILAGLYMDLVKRFVPPHGDDPNWIYRYMFLYSAAFSILASYCSYKVYRGWKRLGGDKSYVPPVHRFRLRDLPPHPDVDGAVNGKLLAFAWISFAGLLLGSAIWVGYYVWWQPNLRYALLFGVAGLVNILLFWLYLRFVRFMERP
jgi:MFS family permease